jgi:hypothetical protein
MGETRYFRLVGKPYPMKQFSGVLGYDFFQLEPAQQVRLGFFGTGEQSRLGGRELS